MIKFLTTNGINFHLEELLKNAQKEIILISPYIQLQRRIKEILSQKKDSGLDIIFVCRAKDLKEDPSRFSTKVFDCPTLHAKCYMNEHEAIVTSLNLYEFSQQNNEEMGFYIKSSSASLSTLQKWFLKFHIKDSDTHNQLFREIATQAKQLCKNQINQFSPLHQDVLVADKGNLLEQRLVKSNQTNLPPSPINQNVLVVSKKYSLVQLDAIFNFGYKGSAGIKKSASGDIVLFSNTSSVYGEPVERDGIIYYQGQNGGLTGNNKDLYDSFGNQSVTIHFFKNYVYVGKFYIKMSPYRDNQGKWFFPLARSN